MMLRIYLAVVGGGATGILAAELTKHVSLSSAIAAAIALSVIYARAVIQ